MDIYENTLKDFPKLVSGVEKGHQSLLIVAEKLAEYNKVGASKKLGMIHIIYSDIVETIECATILCMRGHYECVAKLLRSCFEATYLILKFNSYPEESFNVDNQILDIFNQNKNYGVIEKTYEGMKSPEKEKFEYNLWLDSNNELNSHKVRLVGRIFSSTKLIREFTKFDIPEKYREAYHKLSKFVHPRFYGIMSRLQLGEGKVKFRGVYKADFAEAVLKDIIKAVVLCTVPLKDYMEGLDFTQEEIQLAKEIDEIYEKFV
ncbi:MAG: hypothetical protein HYT70_03645 [Candidatus Aenigmarchaeota archaeon]|nr:hypothetical protein [Candidatus Aenigmarchaeota archaeon]